MAKLNNEAIDTLVDYYYPRAKWLQEECNWGNKSYTGEEANKAVNDPLMQNIEIYDCYTRNAAGFSNVLQDLKFGSETPKWHVQDKERQHISASNNDIQWDLKTWLFVFMVHRITGSGASFQDDHGYRNNVVQYFGKHKTIQEMIEHMVKIKSLKKPLFTSIGNQPPSPRKGVSNLDFMAYELPALIDMFVDWLLIKKRGHKEVVDYLNSYNISVGHRRFNFAYAAFSMDISDYYPELVDEYSHAYLGNNAIRCMKLMSKGYKADDFMDILANKTGGKPKDLEDVLCDNVRFLQNYDPWSRGLYYNNSGYKGADFEDRSK